MEVKFNVGGCNITSNGQYSPNMFDNTPGPNYGNLLPEGQTSTNQFIDQINVNLINKINRFYISTNFKKLSDFTVYSNSISNFIINSNEAVVRIVESNISYTVNLLVNNDVNNKSITLPYDSGKLNKYVKYSTTNRSSVLKLCYNNNSSIIEINDESLDVNFSYVTLSKNKFVIE